MIHIAVKQCFSMSHIEVEVCYVFGSTCRDSSYNLDEQREHNKCNNRLYTIFNLKQDISLLTLHHQVLSVFCSTAHTQRCLQQQTETLSADTIPSQSPTTRKTKNCLDYPKDIIGLTRCIIIRSLEKLTNPLARRFGLPSLRKTKSLE